MSPEPDGLSFAHREEVNSEAKSVEIESKLEDHEFIKGTPQSAEVTIAGENSRVLEVNIEIPPN